MVVSELLAGQVPVGLILVVLMLQWSGVQRQARFACASAFANCPIFRRKVIDFAEFFVGDQAVSRALRAAGFSGHSHDIVVGACMNILGSAGFACCPWFFICTKLEHFNSHFRLALSSVWALRPHGLLWSAPVCSSWVWMSRSVSAGLNLSMIALPGFCFLYTYIQVKMSLFCTLCFILR